MAALAWPELPESPNPPTNCDNPSIPSARDGLGKIIKSRRRNAVALSNSDDRVILIYLRTPDSRRPRERRKARAAGYKNRRTSKLRRGELQANRQGSGKNRATDVALSEHPQMLPIRGYHHFLDLEFLAGLKSQIRAAAGA